MWFNNKRLSENKFIRFCLVGVINTGVDVAVFSCLAPFIAIWLARPVAYLSAMVVSYVLNKTWTFKQPVNLNVPEKIRFLSLNLSLLALSTGLVIAIQENFRISPVAALMLTLPLTVVLSFLGSRLWVFRSAPHG